jgi:ribosomal protein S12 methylthiotransferase accessory factor
VLARIQHHATLALARELMMTANLGYTPLERSLPLLKKLLSPFTGIAHLRFHMMAQPSDPRLWHVTCLTADSHLTIGTNVPKYSGGIHPLRERALAAALGEAAERYSVSFVPLERLRFSSAHALDGPYVDPTQLNFFSPEQYASSDSYVAFDEETPVQWVLGENLHNGQPTWIPSAFCYLPDHRRKSEPRIVYSTSSGVACGATKDEALLGGLYELIERDAFLLMWYNRLSLPILDCAGVAEIESGDRAYYDNTGLHYRVVDLSSFCDVPTAMTIVRDESDYIRLAVGAASAATMIDAVGKSTREAFQTYAWARQMRFLKPEWSEPDDYTTIRDFEDHVALHAFGDHKDQTAFMDASTDRRHVSDVPSVRGAHVREQVSTLLDRLHRRGMDVYAVDVTSPDIRDLGLHVMRAFSPQLCQIDSEHAQRFLGVKRIYTGAFDAGLTPQPLTIETINHFPHPFP